MRCGTNDSSHIREVNLWVTQCNKLTILDVMAADRIDTNLPLREDKFLSYDQGAITKCCKQTIGIVEFDAATITRLVVDSHGNCKELATFMGSNFQVADVADNRLSKHVSNELN